MAKNSDFAGYGLIKLALFPSAISDWLETLQSISKYFILKFQFKKMYIFGYFCVFRCQKLQNYENIDFFSKNQGFGSFCSNYEAKCEAFLLYRLYFVTSQQNMCKNNIFKFFQRRKGCQNDQNYWFLVFLLCGHMVVRHSPMVNGRGGEIEKLHGDS